MIITLGEVAARTLSCDKKTENKELLNGKIGEVHLDKTYKIAHLAHPEIRRINKEWDELTAEAIKTLNEELSKM